jgi:hypothetical protein
MMAAWVVHVRCAPWHARQDGRGARLHASGSLASLMTLPDFRLRPGDCSGDAPCLLRRYELHAHPPQG